MKKFFNKKILLLILCVLAITRFIYIYNYGYNASQKLERAIAGEADLLDDLFSDETLFFSRGKYKKYSDVKESMKRKINDGSVYAPSEYHVWGGDSYDFINFSTLRFLSENYIYTKQGNYITLQGIDARFNILTPIIKITEINSGYLEDHDYKSEQSKIEAMVFEYFFLDIEMPDKEILQEDIYDE